MRKLRLIAGTASLATLAAIWSLTAAAGAACATSACANEAHDKWPGRDHAVQNIRADLGSGLGSGSTSVGSGSTSVPEPGTLPLLALGLGGLGVYGVVRRRRIKA
jgi:hypothetical protein